MAAAPLVTALIRYSNRQIGAIIPDVVIEEAHQDRVVVTPHPVEGGGFISDHAYKLNPVLEIKAGFSDSSAGRAGYSRERYDALRKIADAKQPIEVSTGKRLYKNMLPVGLAVLNDGRTEYSLIAVLALEQITIVSTQTAAGGADPATTASVGEGAPAANQPVTNAGNVETQGVGSQAFAGAYNPGNYSQTELQSQFIPGGMVGSGGGFDLSGGPGAGTAIDPGQMSGLSPSMEITLPEQSVDVPTGDGGRPEGVYADPYNVFGA